MTRGDGGSAQTTIPVLTVAAAAALTLATLLAVQQRGAVPTPDGSPTSAVTSTGTASSTRAVDLSRLEMTVTGFLRGHHRDTESAVAGWRTLTETLVEVSETSDPEAVTSTLERALAGTVATRSGRRALAATEAALDGRILTVAPPDRGRLATGAVRARAAAAPATVPAGTPPPGDSPRVYFVNGALSGIIDATAGAAQLSVAFDAPVDLVYNRSLLRPEDHAVDLCMRGVAARHRARRGASRSAAELGETPMATIVAGADRDLEGTGDAGLTVACATAETVLAAAGLRVERVRDVALSAAELTARWLAGSESAPTPVSGPLLRRLRAHLAHGGRAILVGHSQGTMVVQRALREVTAWWTSAVPPTPVCADGAGIPAPVGALYVSPTVWADTSPEEDLNSGLQRYVALRGDVLGNARNGWVTPTAVPDGRQAGWVPGYNGVVLHALGTYLTNRAEPSVSRQQVRTRFGELRDALAQLTPTGCLPSDSPATPAPSTSPEPSTSASTSASWSAGTGSADPGAPPADSGPWVVWRALAPYAGIGINVTTRRTFETTEVASHYSGGGVDPTATFDRELLLPQEFTSRWEALTTLCVGLVDVGTWPLGAGPHGAWQGTQYALGDGVSCPGHAL